MQTKEMTTGQDVKVVKKPYERPTLMRHGSMVDITAHNPAGGQNDGGSAGQGNVAIVGR